MATADQLLEQIFSWIEQRERCAEQLRKLAGELESLREQHDEYVGSLVPVKGAACLIGAGVVTLLTCGATAPFLVGLGAASVGLTIRLTTKLIEHLKSSDTMKEAQKIEKKSDEIGETIQRLFQKLKAEKEEVSSFADPDELDQHVMTEILRAMARRSGLKQQINISVPGDGDPRVFFDGPINRRLNQSSFKSELMIAFSVILAFFSFQAKGKKTKLLFAKGAEQLIKILPLTGFKSFRKGGGLIVGGAVGMAFALPEATDNWEEMIKKNHVTEASQSLRDTADAILKMTQTLRKQFHDIKMIFDEMTNLLAEQEEQLVLLDKDHEDKQEDDRGDQESGSDEKESDQRNKQWLNSEELVQLWLLSWPWFEEDQGRDQRDKALKMALLNVRSMNEKEEQIKKLITENKLDVFLPTETWLQKDTADTVLREASPPNFSFCHQAREGRGAAILFSQALQGEQHQQHEQIKKPKTFEYVATVLHHDKWGQPVLLINVYRPPGFTQFQQFLDEFQKLLDEVPEEYNSILITGDFNIHFDDDKKNSTTEFIKLLKRNGLDQHVKKPTHQSGHTLDLVITRNVEISGLTVQNDIMISDHYAVTFSARPMTKDAKMKAEDESLKMALVNIWLVNNQPSTISEFITQNKLDVFLATEIGDGDLTLPNFSLHHYVGKRRGGGVAVQFSKALWGKCIHFKFRTFECVAAVLHHGKCNQPVLSINVYRSPGFTQFQQFLEEFQRLLEEVLKHYSIIITGDFNIHVDDKTMPSTTRAFLQLLQEKGLVQHVKEPTHQNGHTLDLVITRNVEISGLTVQNDRISDHYTVYFTAKPVERAREPEL